MAAKYNLTGILYGLGLLVVVHAWRLGDKYLFVNDEARKAFTVKYNPPKAGKGGKAPAWQGLPIR